MKRWFLLLIFLFRVNSYGSSAGPNPPATATSDSSVGTVLWANPERVEVNDGNSASCTLGFAGSTSYYINTSNFGFSIPVGGTIAGISVSVSRYAVIFDGSIRDNAIKLVKGGVVQTTDKASGSNWPLSDTTASYGGASDLWGTTWTPSDVNATNFGFVIQAVSLANTDIDTAQVQYITITISCTPDCTQVSSPDGVIIDEDLP